MGVCVVDLFYLSSAHLLPFLVIELLHYTELPVLYVALQQCVVHNKLSGTSGKSDP